MQSIAKVGKSKVAGRLLPCSISCTKRRQDALPLAWFYGTIGTETRK